MDNLLWILPLLICPLTMLLMGGVVWLAAKFGLTSSEHSEKPAEKRGRDARSAAAPETAGS